MSTMVALLGVACRAITFAAPRVAPPAFRSATRSSVIERSSGALEPIRARWTSLRSICMTSEPTPPYDLCIVDGHALAYRMHYAMGRLGLTTSTGAPSHALHGFLSKLIELHDNHPSHHFVVAWDLPGATFRTAAQDSYKEQRAPMPMDLRPQIDAMRQACGHLRVPALSSAGFEADDVIATCVARARDAGSNSVIIVSPDKDMMQLVSEEDEGTRVTIWNDQKKMFVDANAVYAQYGVRPTQMGDLLALMGARLRMWRTAPSAGQ